MSAQRVLNGRYEVGELIGRGGMADVHLGRDILLGRAVAIKCLRADLARDPLFQSRFRREAQAVAGLNHPSIVSVYDTGEDDVDDGSIAGLRAPFIVMEYVAGRTLRDLSRSGEISIDQAIDYTLGVLLALEYSHRSGIVHRDIKPANVIVTPDSDVKVMDFGIARAMADSAATVTQTQAVIGTAQYLSPEQARGETVDARSDLYSAGCLLYEMLTGRPPFVGDSPVSVAYQHVRELPEQASRFNPEVSAPLDAVLAHALQKNREDRFQDAAAFRRSLRAARSGVTLTPRTPTASVAPTVPVPWVAGADTMRQHEVPEAAAALQDAGPHTQAISRADPEGPARARALSGEDGSANESRQAHDDDGRPDGPAVHHHGAHALNGNHRNNGYDRDDGYDGSGPGDGRLRLGNAEEHHPAHRTRRRAWIAVLWIAVVLVLGTGAFLLYSFLTAPEPPPPTVAVPSVAKMSEVQALNAIQGADLRPIIVEVHDGKIKEGHAVDTSPKSGTHVLHATEVKVHISLGPASITIPPSLAGKTEAYVRQTLSSLNLKGGATEQMNSATVPTSMLISTQPALGDSAPAGSTVDLIISTGKVAVPQLIGLTRDGAEAALTDPAVALPVKFKSVERSVVKPGTVVAQSEPAKTAIEQGTEIVLSIARKPKEPPKTASPSPSPTGTATDADEHRKKDKR